MSISPSGSITSVSDLRGGTTKAIVADFNNDGKNDFVTGSSVGATSGVTLLMNTIPSMTLSAQNTVCLGSSITITVSGADTYVWNTGSTTNPLTVSPTTNTNFTVTGTILT
jgi:hypothetical protein